jgi:bifunctional non-homologous end joining protein LigD
MLPRIQPIAPTRIRAAFDDEAFVFELKHDGFRALAYIEDGGCRLISRKQIQYKSFAGLCGAISRLRVRDAILDGEIVALGSDRRSQFMDLIRHRTQNAILYAFDLLWLDGQDLRPLPLLERKLALSHLLKLSHTPAILFADHVEGIGTSFYKAVCARDCEGVVAKHKHAPYVTSPATWFKILSPDYSQARGRKEMFEAFHDRNATSANVQR